MKIFKFKKTWASLAMVLLLAVFAMHNKPTLAASSPPAQITVGQTTYTADWVDRSHVKIDATNKSTGKTISSVLTDGAWDSNWEYTVSDPPSWSTCGSMKMNGFGSAIVGMTSRSGRGAWGSSDSYGNLTVQDGSCSNIIDNQQIKIGQWQNAGISFKATASDTIDVIDQGQSLTFSNPRLQSDGTVRYYLGGQLGDTCQEIIVVNFSKKTDSNFPISSMEYFDQKTDGSYQSPLSSTCKLTYIASHPPQHGSADDATISYYSFPLENFGTLQEPTSTQDGNGSGGSSGGGSGGSTSTSCESNFNSAFSWIVCPMLGFADGAIGFFYGQVENQLCFNTGVSSTAGNFSCGAAKDTSLADGVKSAWSIFKNIASALLVIVMLIMVISQAVGGGPFDAYTVRKMLPKLVAAVIIMQLSWILLKFAIDLSNDLGAAIGNLMMAPFGGPGHMDLGSMLGRAVDTATGSQPGNSFDVGQTSFDVFAGVAAIGLFVWAIPTLPLLALYVFIGAFIAFFTLILRKLLIIMLVILAPLALIAWLLPGTEKYWKLWSDNFSKLLIMFPMIMAMLSAGRIFAYITSLSGNSAVMFSPHLALAHVGFLPVPYVASATGFVDIVIVIVAFFAPYFLLPKTYSWGGQMMGAVGKQVENFTNKGAEPAKKLLKNREESYRAERRRKSQERVANDVGFQWTRPWQKPIDLARSGKVDPTLGLPGSRRRRQSIDNYVFEGIESEEKDLKSANARAQHTIDRLHFEDRDDYARLLASGRKAQINSTTGRMVRDTAGNVVTDHASEIERRAGYDQVVRLGGDGNIEFLQQQLEEALASGSPERISGANRVLTAHATTLFKKMPHLYKNPDYHATHDVARTVEGLNAPDLTELSAPSFETLIQQAQLGGDVASENRLTSLYIQTVNDVNRRGSIASRINRDMYAYASRLPAADPRRAEILRHVNADGTLIPV